MASQAQADQGFEAPPRPTEAILFVGDDGATSGVNGVDVIIEVIRIDGTFWTMTFATANDPATGLPGWYNFDSVPAGKATGYVDPATIPAGLMLGSHACGGPIQFVIALSTVFDMSMFPALASSPA
jgi:hypothetical protein